MLTLPHLLTTARRFVDGVCALQDVTKLTDAINGWTNQREEILRGSFLRLLKDLGYEHASMLRWLNDQAIESDYLPPKWHARVDELEQQIAAEREAHKETYAELSAARADLEALTRWRLQSEEPCPVPTFVEVSINSPRLGICLDRCGKLEALDSWRHTPESLAAWKAREGGGE